MADRCHRWIVLLAAVLVMWLSFGFAFQFGVFFIPMLNQYGESRSNTAIVQSLLMGCALCFGVVAGLLNAKFGHGRVFLVGAILSPLGTMLSFFGSTLLIPQLCIGIVTGIGVNFLFISSAVVLGKVFEGPTRLLALALHLSAGSVSGLTHPTIIRWLLNTYGLNGSFLILGGCFLNNIAAAIIFWNVKEVPRPQSICDDRTSTEKKGDKFQVSEDQSSLLESNGVEKGDNVNMKIRNHHPDTDKDNSIGVKIGKIMSVPYVLFVVGTCVCAAPVNAYQSLVLDIFRWKGYSQQQGLMSFFAFNIVGLIGRTLPGIMKQRKGVNSLVLDIGFSVCGITGFLLILLSLSYGTILAGAAAIGLCLGGAVSSGSVIVVKLVPEECFSIAVGIVFTMIGIVTAIAGPFFGAMRDGLETYTHVLILSVLLEFTGTVMFSLSLFIRNRRRSRSAARNKEANVAADMPNSSLLE